MIVLKISYVTQFRQGADSISKIENKFRERFGELNVKLYWVDFEKNGSNFEI
jgi:hypothetical protein